MNDVSSEGREADYTLVSQGDTPYNEVYVWGNNNSGQLGTGSEYDN